MVGQSPRDYAFIAFSELYCSCHVTRHMHACAYWMQTTCVNPALQFHVLRLLLLAPLSSTWGSGAISWHVFITTGPLMRDADCVCVFPRVPKALVPHVTTPLLRSAFAPTPQPLTAVTVPPQCLTSLVPARAGRAGGACLPVAATSR